jgi:hypothetical protein
VATEPVLHTKVSEVTASTQRYTLSWIDRLLAKITRLPGPNWLFYLVLLISLVFVNNGLQWMDGTVPTGTFDRGRTADVIFPVYFLALMQYLNTCARRAMYNFRPVTDLNDADYAHLSHELQTVPAWPALAVGMAGVAFVIRAILAEPATFGIFPSSSLLTILFIGALSVFWGAVFFVFIFHTVRQLNFVNRIYRRATRIELFHLKPVYAFSALTARTGIGLILFIYFLVAINSADSISTSDELNFILFDDFLISGDLFGLLLIGALLLTGIAAFVWPLQGIHQRLVEEKESNLAKVADRLTLALGKLHQNVDSDNFDQMDGIHNALSSLKLEREELDKISTWPWERGTLNGFVTAILIPILLWLLTRLLEKFI